MKRLSDAIDEGSLLKPQAFRPDLAGHSCALEAASEALGQDPGLWSVLDFTHYKWTRGATTCPACGYADAIFDTIYHLNDDHEWARPRIAEWLRTIEPQEQQEVPQPESVEVRG